MYGLFRLIAIIFIVKPLSLILLFLVIFYLSNLIIMQLGPWGHCCLIFSAVGFIFFLYLTLLCLLDPERLHIVTHHDEKKDAERYYKAWTSSAISGILYLLIACVLLAIKYSKKEDAKKLKSWLESKESEDRMKSTYELSEFHRQKDEQEEQLVENK